MKCVCPMGGDRTCPDDCPLAVWQGLSSTDRRSQRRPIAERLFRQGFTQEAIATQLGASQATIHRDLREFIHDEITPSRTSRRGRVNEGRPRGSRSRRRTQRQEQNVGRNERIVALSDGGMTATRIAPEVGLGARVVSQIIERERIRRDATAEPEVDPTTLSSSARERLEAAMRQHKRTLEATFERRVQDAIKERVEETVLPHYNQKLAEYDAVIKSRRGIMTRVAHRKILACLHPDSRRSATERTLTDAFNTFNALEIVFLDERERPTHGFQMPRTYEEMMALRRSVSEARRSRRSGSVTRR